MTPCQNSHKIKQTKHPVSYHSVLCYPPGASRMFLYDISISAYRLISLLSAGELI